MNLKFLPENEVKKKFVQFTGDKNDWRTRNSMYVFLRIIYCHNGIGYGEKVEEENLGSRMVAEEERKKSL